MWDLPGPGLEPVSPALAGGFLTTAPPENAHFLTLEKGKSSNPAGNRVKKTHGVGVAMTPPPPPAPCGPAATVASPLFQRFPCGCHRPIALSQTIPTAAVVWPFLGGFE